MIPISSASSTLMPAMKMLLKKNRPNPVSTDSVPPSATRKNTRSKFSRVGSKNSFGGTESASVRVLKAVRMIHSTGKK